MTPLGTDRERIVAAERERQRIKRAYPEEIHRRRAARLHRQSALSVRFFLLAARGRNAWFAGWNVGYCDRKRGERDGHG